MKDTGVSILKTIWSKQPDGRWGIQGMKGLTFLPKKGQDKSYFAFEGELELMTSNPSGFSMHELFRSFGTTDFLVKQSIVPVVAWVHKESVMRTIGTGFFVSCTGYLMTACHVLLDPEERGYGIVHRDGHRLRLLDGLEMGVLVPINPATGQRGMVFLPFESSWYWGDWKNSPLIHENERFDMLTDIAICKVPTWPRGEGHQPLNLSLNAFSREERAFVLGYAEMPDISFETKKGLISLTEPQDELFVAVGNVMNVFPNNHLSREVPTPGPCFDFAAKVPGKMSGAPIFGADGAVVRGVVSRSYSGEQHAYGAMLGPAMHLPLGEGTTLHNLMENGNEGIAQIHGSGL
ncbi:MAG: trypsin-like peptidase domain-containing protein [Sulfuricaulis sp.]